MHINLFALTSFGRKKNGLPERQLVYRSVPIVELESVLNIIRQIKSINMVGNMRTFLSAIDANVVAKLTVTDGKAKGGPDCCFMVA